MKWFEVMWPLLPTVWGWLRHRKRKCHPRRGCMRVIPEAVGRKLPPIVYKRY